MPSTRVRTRPSRAVALLTAALLVVSLPVVVPSVAVAAPPTDKAITLTGSLQTELGCDVDWDPGCAASQLPWDESAQRYRKTFDLPAGSYEYKITVDGGWDENYGAGGAAGGANIPLVLAVRLPVTFTYDPTTHVVAPSWSTPSLSRSQERTLAGTSLREDLTREQFYFVMADRFANGSTANDLGGLTGDRLTTGFDPTDKGFYHGGDLKGLASKLDYLKGMGTTAIWMTPAFKNRPVQGTDGTESAGYHGYWITDFTQIDPHLGTNAELTELIDKAHRRGMKLTFRTSRA